MGLLTGVITLRLRGLYLGLTTWFVAEAVRLTISNATDYTRGVMGLNVAPFPDLLGISFARGQLLPYYDLLLVLAALILGSPPSCCAPASASPSGPCGRTSWRRKASASTRRLKLLNFTLASAFTGVMGAFYCRYLGILPHARRNSASRARS